MESTLTQKELDTIAVMVVEKLKVKLVAEGSTNELRKAAENYTKNLIDFYLRENEVAPDVAKMIKPIFDKHIIETKIVENQMKSYMNSEHFKKLELHQLRERVRQIERELEEESDGM